LKQLHNTKKLNYTPREMRGHLGFQWKTFGAGLKNERHNLCTKQHLHTCNIKRNKFITHREKALKRALLMQSKEKSVHMLYLHSCVSHRKGNFNWHSFILSWDYKPYPILTHPFSKIAIQFLLHATEREILHALY
jgi:hypothetical protein